MAPELGHAGQTPDPRTEVYALGCTLFHLLARRPPFIGRDPLSKLASHAAEKIPTAEQAGMPPILNQVLAGMLAKDPARRYQHPRQVGDVLGQILAKFDPDQLKSHASPTPNRLPEFEAWLQPYKIAIDSQKHYAPEIEMPPILAASMPPPVPSLTSPGVDDALDILAPDAAPTSSNRTPPPVPAGAGGQPMQSRPAATATPPIPVAPAKAQLAPPPIAKANVNSTSNVATVAAPAPVGMSQMIFPPDQDVLVPAVRIRKPPQQRKKANVAVLVSGVAVLIATAVLLWVVLNKKHNSDPAAADKPTEPAASDRATEREISPAKPNSEDSAPGPSKNNGAGSTRPAPNQSVLTSVSDNSSPAVSPDEGKPLWASPTNGAPLSLAHLPSGVQAVLVLRPAELLASPEADKLLAALGPEGNAVRQEWESIAGSSLANVEQLTVAWIDSAGADASPMIVPMYVFQYVRPPDTKKINENWLNFSKPEKFANEEIFQPTKELSAYFHHREKRPLLLVVGPIELVKESAELADRPPPVRREIEKLIRTTDNARQATLLWLPDNSLVMSATEASTAWAKLIAGARSFFGDDCRGAVHQFPINAVQFVSRVADRGSTGYAAANRSQTDSPTNCPASHDD